MSTEQTPKYSAADLSRMSESRHWSDHELLYKGINGKASYIGDRLAPSAEQIEAIRREHDAQHIAVEQDPATDIIPVRHVGEEAMRVVMRHSPDVEQVHRDAGKTIEDLEQERQNLENLVHATELMVRDYDASLYADKIPTGKTLRGRFTDRLIRAEPWTDNKPIGNFDASFRTTLFYKQGKDKNVLSTASILAQQRGAPEYYEDTRPLLHLDYSADGDITSLALDQLYRCEAYDNLLGQRSEPRNPAGEFIAKSVRLLNTEPHQVRVELTGTPKVIVSEWGTRSRMDTKCEYRYEADKDEFTLYATDSQTRPKVLSTTDYLNLIDGMLRLVPTTKVEI